MKKYILVFLAGFILGGSTIGTGVGLIMKHLQKEIECPEQKVKDQITTTPISGSPGTIKHDRWNFKGQNKTICFETISTGKAKTKTTIDKDLIPEAHKWMSYHDAIQLSYEGLIFGDGFYRQVFGADWLHRWGWFAIGGGPRVSYYTDKTNKKNFGGGFSVCAQAWFKGI